MLQPLNIDILFEIEEVSKFFKFNDINEKQSVNILSNCFTLEVLKLVKFNDIKELQPLNIFFIIVTEEVLKFFKFKNFNDLQL